MKNFKSKFEKLYNIVMEQIEEQICEVLKQKAVDIVSQLPDISDENYYAKTMEFFKRNDVDISKYEPIIRDGTLKVVPEGLIDKSIVKEGIKDVNKEFSIDKIKNKEKLNVFFYFLKQKISENDSYQLKAISKSSLDAETAQINKISGDISKLGGEIKIQTPDGTVGPFNEVKKVNGTPKADAVLMSTKNDNSKMYLSLKNGGKAARFRQYGGKRDLAETDDELLKNSFINKCYNAIIALFDNVYFKNPNVKNKSYDFSAVDIKDTLSEYVFIIPKFAYDSFKKTKWGKNFGSNQRRN